MKKNVCERCVCFMRIFIPYSTSFNYSDKHYKQWGTKLKCVFTDVPGLFVCILFCQKIICQKIKCLNLCLYFCLFLTDESPQVTAFLTLLSQWDKPEIEETLCQRVEFSKRAIGKLLQVWIWQ